MKKKNSKPGKIIFALLLSYKEQIIKSYLVTPRRKDGKTGLMRRTY